MQIRKATLNDLDEIKALADENRYELGFVLRPALIRSINRKEVFVAERNKSIVGFVEYHHRRDSQTTIYHIAVCKTYRRVGVGRALINAVIEEAKKFNKKYILLKCPIDLPANKFYERLGFENFGICNGRNRKLIIWIKKLS